MLPETNEDNDVRCRRCEDLREARRGLGEARRRRRGGETKSPHIKAGDGSAFAGVHPRKGALLLNIRLAEKLTSKRMKKTERVSKSRWHNEMILASPTDIDGEVVAWLKAAHALAAPSK